MAFIKGWASAAALLALAILASSCGSCRAVAGTALVVADLPTPYQALTGCYAFGEMAGQVCFWNHVDIFGSEGLITLSFSSDVTLQTTIAGNNGYKIEIENNFAAVRLELVCSTTTEATGYTAQADGDPAIVTMNIDCPDPTSPTLVFKSYAQLSFPKAGEITQLAAGVGHGRALISVDSVKALFAETVITNLASQFPAFSSWFLTGAGAANTSRITFLDFSYALNTIGVTYTIDLPETGFAVGSAGLTAIDSALRSPAIFTGNLTNTLGTVTVKYVAYVCLASGTSCVHFEDVPNKRSVDDDAVSIGVGVGLGVGLTLLAVIGFAVKYWFYDAKQIDGRVNGGVADP